MMTTAWGSCDAAGSAGGPSGPRPVSIGCWPTSGGPGGGGVKVARCGGGRGVSRGGGVSRARDRSGVRVRQAMDQLAQGEPSLADLAARLGFADQAHLARTVREHLGYTPSTLRPLLAPVSQAG